MPFWKPKKKKKAVYKAKPAKSLPKYEPKPFIPPEIPKIDISTNQQKEPQKPAPKKASSSRADDKKYFIETFNKLVSERNRPWDIWKDFVLMTACAFSNAVDKTHYDEREDRYLKAIAKYRKEEQALFPELLAEMTVALEKNPDQDFLGEVYMRMRLGSDELKQIFTPYNVCHFMALATMGNVAEQVEKSGFITVHDDCCGGGATLIAAANVARNDLEKAGLNFQTIFSSRLRTSRRQSRSCAIFSYRSSASPDSSRSAILLPIRSEMVTLWRTTGLRPCTLAMFGILVELSVK